MSKDFYIGKIENKVHHYPFRIAYADTDAGGIVYHSKYMDLTERARAELWAMIGKEHNKETGNVGFVLKSSNIEYKSPAKLDDIVTVQTKYTKVGKTSLTLEQKIYKDDTLLIIQNLTLVYVNKDIRPIRIPEYWINAFEKLL